MPEDNLEVSEPKSGNEPMGKFSNLRFFVYVLRSKHFSFRVNSTKI